MAEPYLVIEVRVSQLELVALRGDDGQTVDEKLRALLAHRGIVFDVPGSTITHTRSQTSAYDLFRQVIPRQEAPHG